MQCNDRISISLENGKSVTPNHSENNKEKYGHDKEDHDGDDHNQSNQDKEKNGYWCYYLHTPRMCIYMIFKNLYLRILKSFV